MKKKALFFDYDGTLISDETHTIPKSARKVLNKLKDKGYLLFLNTGRTKAILDPIISELDFEVAVVISNTMIKCCMMWMLISNYMRQLSKRLLRVMSMPSLRERMLYI